MPLPCLAVCDCRKPVTHFPWKTRQGHFALLPAPGPGNNTLEAWPLAGAGLGHGWQDPHLCGEGHAFSALLRWGPRHWCEETPSGKRQVCVGPASSSPHCLSSPGMSGAGPLNRASAVQGSLDNFVLLEKNMRARSICEEQELISYSPEAEELEPGRLHLRAPSQCVLTWPTCREKETREASLLL